MQNEDSPTPLRSSNAKEFRKPDYDITKPRLIRTADKVLMNYEAINKVDEPILNFTKTPGRPELKKVCKYCNGTPLEQKQFRDICTSISLEQIESCNITCKTKSLQKEIEARLNLKQLLTPSMAAVSYMIIRNKL